MTTPDEEPGGEGKSAPGFRSTFGEAYRDNYRRSHERSFRTTYGPSFAIGYLWASGRFWPLFGPVIAAALVGSILAVAGVQGRVSPEYFGIVAGVIPTLALAIFIVVDRRAREVSESERLAYQMLGWGLGYQLLVGEAVSLYGVADQARSRTLALIVGAVVVAEILFLVRYTFGLVQPESVGDVYRAPGSPGVSTTMLPGRDEGAEVSPPDLDDGSSPPETNISPAS